MVAKGATTTVCHLRTAAQAVVDNTAQDAQRICGDKTTKKLKHLHSGHLRPSLGPYFQPHVQRYEDGRIGVAIEEDGSGFGYYPSGRKAISVSDHQKARRFSCMIFDDVKGSPILGSINEWGMGKVE